MDKLEAILRIVREKGPILPVQVSKEVSDSILMTSARLSELLSSKKIRVSNLKVGGSPLYYFPGQESKLQDFSSNLGNMEQKALGILSQGKVVKDSDQEPAIRVALRQITDFAVPLKVTYNNQSQVFWKWYLVSAEEAQGTIKGIISNNVGMKSQLSDKTTKEGEHKKENIGGKKFIQEKTQEIPTKGLQTQFQKTDLDAPTSQNIAEIKKQPKSNFMGKVQKFFDNNSIEVTYKFLSKKQTDNDYIISLSTPIGNIGYYCRSRSKKRVSDSDLSSALVQAQAKTMPLLYLSDGELTKKAREMLDKELKNTIFKKL
jgi:hypothetical protein